MISLRFWLTFKLPIRLRNNRLTEMNRSELKKILGRQLQPRPTTDDEWQVWEHKTLNIHRGVLHWQPKHEVLSAVSLIEGIRAKAQQSFRMAW